MTATLTEQQPTTTATAPLWATGNGTRRHIVRPGSMRVSAGRRFARALCDHPARPVVLIHFADDTSRSGRRADARTNAELVAAARPCRQCAHRAIRADAEADQ